MALIAAIFGSLLGLFAGLASALFFGTSLLQSTGIYAGVALSTIAVFSLRMLITSRRADAAERDAREKQLDREWAHVAQHALADGEDAELAFREQLETPLSASEQRTGRDRDSA